MPNTAYINSARLAENPFAPFAESIQASDCASTRLYIVTKELAAGARPRSARLHKHRFRLMKMDMEPQVQQQLFGLAKAQLARLAGEPEMRPVSYQILHEQGEGELYYYSLLPEEPFYELTQTQLLDTSSCPTIRSLSEVKDKAHAYVVKVEISGEAVFLFARLHSGRIALAERKPHWFDFNTTNSKLALNTNETIELRESFDCIWLGDRFYFLDVERSEQILCMEEAHKVVGDQVLAALEPLDIVTDMERVRRLSGKKNSLNKTLAHLFRNGVIEQFSNTRRQQMLEAIRNDQLPIEVDNDRLKISKDKDVTTFIRLLNNWYVRCVQTGALYGSSRKRKLS